MAGQDNTPSRKFQEYLNSLHKRIEGMLSELRHEADRYALELDQRSKALEAKAERFEQLENALEEKVHASFKQKVDTRNVGIQAGQQSAAYDARKLYGDLIPGDKTHRDVQLAFVKYFSKHQRSFSGIFLRGTSSTPLCNAPCYIFQVAYQQAKKYILYCFVEELMKQFRSKDVEDADILADSKRVLMMLLDNAKTAPEFHDIVAFVSQSDQQQNGTGTLCFDDKKLEEEASKLVWKELNQLFVGAPSLHSNAMEVWEKRRCSFGILLHITGIKQSQQHEALKRDVLLELEKYKSECAGLFAKVPTLIEESVKIVWDMVTLNPPAISCLPQDFSEDWHNKHATLWKDSRGTNTLVYYNPVLFFSFDLDVACKGEVGNNPPGSASTSHTTNSMVCGSAPSGNTSVKRVCVHCNEETKPENMWEDKGGASVCLLCYQQYVFPRLTHCRYCQQNIQSSGGGYYIEGCTSMICKRCHSERFLHCKKCKRRIFGERLSVQALEFTWHSTCLKCYICRKTITSDCYPHPQYPQEPICYNCVKKIKSFIKPQ